MGRVGKKNASREVGIFFFFPNFNFLKLECKGGKVKKSWKRQTHGILIIIRARSHTGVMDYNEACFMHLTHGMVHNFPEDVSV